MVNHENMVTEKLSNLQLELLKPYHYNIEDNQLLDKKEYSLNILQIKLIQSLINYGRKINGLMKPWRNG